MDVGFLRGGSTNDSHNPDLSLDSDLREQWEAILLPSTNQDCCLGCFQVRTLDRMGICDRCRGRYNLGGKPVQRQNSNVLHCSTGTLGFHGGNTDLPQPEGDSDGQHNPTSHRQCGGSLCFKEGGKQEQFSGLNSKKGRSSSPTEQSAFVESSLHPVSNKSSRPPSRLNDQGSWMTLPWVWSLLLSIVPPLDMDLFACNLSAVVPCFFSMTLCPNSAGVNAFAKTWPQKVWMCPPLSIIAPALATLFESQTHALVVAPSWKCPWLQPLLHGSAWLLTLDWTSGTMHQPVSCSTELSQISLTKWIAVWFCPNLFVTRSSPPPEPATSRYVQPSTPGHVKETIALSLQQMQCCQNMFGPN